MHVNTYLVCVKTCSELVLTFLFCAVLSSFYSTYTDCFWFWRFFISNFLIVLFCQEKIMQFIWIILCCTCWLKLFFYCSFKAYFVICVVHLIIKRGKISGSWVGASLLVNQFLNVFDVHFKIQSAHKCNVRLYSRARFYLLRCFLQFFCMRH